MDVARLTFSTSSGPKQVLVEVALTKFEQIQGLSGRSPLPPNTGMLFLNPEPNTMKFWMRGVSFPLDMIFIGVDGQVVQINKNCTPMSLDPCGPDEPVQCMLEIAGGWADANDVGVFTPCTIEEL